MSKICEHEFEQEDPTNRGYSLTEYDLYADLGMAIRKNLKTGKFEIIKIKDNEVQYTGNIDTIVKIANSLEKDQNTWIECGTLCPKNRGK